MNATFIATLSQILDVLGLDPLQHGVQILDASALMPPAAAVPATPADRAWVEMVGKGTYAAPLQPFPLLPTRPVLLANAAAEYGAVVQTTLADRYPADHPITLIDIQTSSNTNTVLLHQLSDAIKSQAAALWLFVPPLEPLADVRGPEGINTVVTRLLGPYGCPWDREQTHQSLRAGLLEETHEVLEALDTDDHSAMAEEFGDLLMQVLVHSEMARQAGSFTLGEVYEHIATKLVRRHPHVFGETTVDGSGEVLRNWDAIKQQERADKGAAPRGILDGVPPSLPTLTTAQKIIGKAAKSGFAWPAISDAWNKLGEELDELRAAASADTSGSARAVALEDELGDVLFALVGLARWLGVDAESAMRSANSKFRRRFSYLEQQLGARPMREVPIDELLALWGKAKRNS